jgi:hypothetical protein
VTARRHRESLLASIAALSAPRSPTSRRGVRFCDDEHAGGGAAEAGEAFSIGEKLASANVVGCPESEQSPLLVPVIGDGVENRLECGASRQSPIEDAFDNVRGEQV